MKPISTILFLLFACVSFSFAQQTNSAQETTKINKSPTTIQREMTISELQESLEGTYQVEMTPSNKSLFYTKAFFQTIKDARKEDEDVTIQWDQFTTITVYSYQSLEATNE